MAFGPIATLPNALPALFQLTGQAVPKGYSDVIQPSIEVLELLAATNCLEVITAAVQIVSSSGVVRPPELVVPATECWLVRGASAYCSTTGTDSIRMALHQGRAVSGGQAVARRWAQSFSHALDSTASGFVMAAMDQSPIVLFANDYIGLDVSKLVTMSSIAIQFQAQIFRFSI